LVLYRNSHWAWEDHLSVELRFIEVTSCSVRLNPDW